MSFVHRQIVVVLQYVGEAAQTLTGHRVSVAASISGGAGMAQVQVRIFGMQFADMNKFSTIGQLPAAFKPNTITILAGNVGAQPSQIFQGTIQAAWLDMQSAPEVSFNITGLGGLIEALTNIPASSFPGSVDAAVVLKGLAAQAGLNFENNGVSVMLSRPNYPGSARDQIQSCISSAGIQGVIDNGTLAIWPRGGSRTGTAALISPSTGMVGYPTYTSTGVLVTTEFNPQVRFGALVQVESSLPQANGPWRVVNLVHDIEAEMPNGKWFTQMQLSKQDYVLPV